MSTEARVEGEEMKKKVKPASTIADYERNLSGDIESLRTRVAQYRNHATKL